MLKEIRKSFSFRQPSKPKNRSINQWMLNSNKCLLHLELKEQQKKTTNDVIVNHDKSNKTVNGVIEDSAIKVKGKKVFKNKGKKTPLNQTVINKSKHSKGITINNDLNNTNEKTIQVSSQQQKLIRNSSHRSFSLNKMKINCSSPLNISLQKRKLINDYLGAITNNNHWSKNDFYLNKDEIEKNHEENEGWAKYIQEEGFEENKENMNKKNTIIIDLQDKLISLKDQISIVKKEKAQHIYIINKLKHVIDQDAMNLKTCQYERSIMTKEIEEIKKEIQPYESKLQKHKEETIQLNELFENQKKEIGQIAHAAQQITSHISTLMREKETIQSDIKVSRKQLEAIQFKLSNASHKNINFMIDVNELVGSDLISK